VSLVASFSNAVMRSEGSTRRPGRLGGTLWHPGQLAQATFDQREWTTIPYSAAELESQAQHRARAQRPAPVARSESLREFPLDLGQTRELPTSLRSAVSM